MRVWQRRGGVHGDVDGKVEEELIGFQEEDEERRQEGI